MTLTHYRLCDKCYVKTQHRQFYPICSGEIILSMSSLPCETSPTTPPPGRQRPPPAQPHRLSASVPQHADPHTFTACPTPPPPDRRFLLAMCHHHCHQMQLWHQGAGALCHLCSWHPGLLVPRKLTQWFRSLPTWQNFPTGQISLWFFSSQGKGNVKKKGL